MFRVSIGFAVLLMVILATGCGDDGNGGPTGPPKTPLAGEVNGPPGTEPGDFVVYGGGSSVPVDAEGRFTLPDTPGDTTLIMAVANGDETKPLLNLAGPQSTSATLNLRTTAVTMVLLSPEFATDDDERRARVAAAAEGVPETAALATALEAAYGQPGDPLDRPEVLEAWQRAIEATGLALVGQVKSAAPAATPQPYATIAAAGTEVTLYDLHSPLIAWEVRQPGGPGTDIRLKGTSIGVLNWYVAAQEVDPGQWPDGFYGVHGVIWSTPLALKPNGLGISGRVPGFSLSAWANFIGATVDHLFEELAPSPGTELVFPGNRPGVYVIRSFNGASHKDPVWDRAIRDWDRASGSTQASRFRLNGVVLNDMDAVFSVLKVALIDIDGVEPAVRDAALALSEHLWAGSLTDGVLTEREIVDAMVEALRAAGTSLIERRIVDEAGARTVRATTRLLSKKMLPHLEAIAGIGRVAEIVGGTYCGLYHETCMIPIEASILVVGDPWSGHEPEPDAISDLTATQIGANSVTLRWTAPDPRDTGTRSCSAYDLRYSPAAITDANWNNARQVEGEPAPPLQAGRAQTMTVSGLDDGRTYYFCIRAADMGANWSALSNLLRVDTPAEQDFQAPGVIRDFRGEVDGPYSATLRWIASGDDGYEGTAERYELQYSTGANYFVLYPFPAELPRPKPAGQPEVFALTGLTPDTEYHFKIRVSDGRNWSPPSSGFVNLRTPPPDIVPPSPVTDLTVSALEGSMTSATVRWTAPGDDEDAGQAAQYDLRYARTPIDAGSFENASRVQGVASPRPAGQVESAVVTGLLPGTTYYFALKVADEVPNWSDLSNVVPFTTPSPDVTPPASVRDLSVRTSTQNSVTLAWTSVGDDGTSGGPAREYDLRFALTEITAQTFHAASRVAVPAGPKPPNQPETFTVTGLQPSGIYYFALKVADEVPNWSDLSNVVPGRTANPPTPPTASFTVTPAWGTVSTTFQFDASGSSDDADPVSALQVRWDFEDDGVWDTPYTTTKTASRQYATTGVKTIKLQVRDTQGLEGTATRQVTVGAPPTASFTVTPAWGTVSTTFQFDASGSSDDADPVSALQVRWDFEDDGVWDTPYATTKTASRQYGTTGVKTIKLQVKDTQGLEGTATRQVTVGDEPRPDPVFVGDVSVSATAINLGGSITLAARVRNDGAASGYGGISVSFPDLNGTSDEGRVQCTSTVNDAPGHQTFAKQETINDQNCQPMSAQYLLAEYGDNGWTQGEENAYTLVVTPKAEGVFDIYIRCAMKVGTDPQNCTYVPALPPNGTSGASDQQGWPVKRFEVRVDPAPPPPGGMVLVQPGTFTMGSPSSEPGRDSDESQHQVTLTKAFYLSTTEVTQSEWQSVMGWNDSYFSGPNRPVESVTWYDCVEFCNRKSASAGLTAAYAITNVSYSGNHIVSATVTWNQGANGYRLPTESEWEYACRATSQTAFCNGGITELGCGNEPNLTQVGWYCGNSGSQTHDVGGKAANLWGLKDMHGNVWEWCWDWYGSYPSGPVTDPVGAGSGSARVFRGGSWLSLARLCRSAYRFWSTPGYRFTYLGLRLSRTAS